MKTIFAFLIVVFMMPSLCSAFNDSLFVTFNGDTTKIWDTRAYENCAARFNYSVVFLDSNTIVITEWDTVKAKANCMCFFDLCISLTGLNEDTITVEVYRQYRKEFGYPTDTTVYIGTLTFKATTPPGTISQGFNQSPCYQPVGVLQDDISAQRFTLFNAYPNPFNPTAVISYSLPTNSFVTLKIYNMLGQELGTLLNEMQDVGHHEVRFDGSSLPAGIYFYKLESGSFRGTRKFILLK